MFNKIQINDCNSEYMKTERGFVTTVQEYNGKFTTPIPMGLVKLLGIKKSDKLIWNLYDGSIAITVIKTRYQ